MPKYRVITNSLEKAHKMYEEHYGWPHDMTSRSFHLHHTHGRIEHQLYINDVNSMILIPIYAHADHGLKRKTYPGYGFKKGYDSRRGEGFKKGHYPANPFKKGNPYRFKKGRIPVHMKRAKLIRLLNELEEKRKSAKI